MPADGFGGDREIALLGSLPKGRHEPPNPPQERRAAVCMLLRLTASHAGSREELERAAELLGLDEPLSELLGIPVES